MAIDLSLPSEVQALTERTRDVMQMCGERAVGAAKRALRDAE